jgi:hypothetical protein
VHDGSIAATIYFVHPVYPFTLASSFTASQPQVATSSILITHISERLLPLLDNIRNHRFRFPKRLSNSITLIPQSPISFDQLIVLSLQVEDRLF